MNRLFAFIVILLIGISVTAQDQVPLTREEKKALRKEEKKQREKVMAMNTAQAIKTGNFVLKANRISGRGGFVTTVDPTINFVSVQGPVAYVQLGSESGLGLNGVGGITLKGNITSYKVTNDDNNGNYFILINTSGISGTLTITMRVNLTGDMASASVTTNWGSTVNFDGDLYPHSKARVFKGTETF